MIMTRIDMTTVVCFHESLHRKSDEWLRLSVEHEGEVCVL